MFTKVGKNSLKSIFYFVSMSGLVNRLSWETQTLFLLPPTALQGGYKGIAMLADRQITDMLWHIRSVHPVSQ